MFKNVTNYLQNKNKHTNINKIKNTTKLK